MFNSLRPSDLRSEQRLQSEKYDSMPSLASLIPAALVAALLAFVTLPNVIEANGSSESVEEALGRSECRECVSRRSISANSSRRSADVTAFGGFKNLASRLGAFRRDGLVPQAARSDLNGTGAYLLV